MRILGVDPGTRIAGYGVLDAAGGARLSLVACGAIRMPAAGMPERLRVLYEELVRLIEEHRPRILSVETVFHGKSFQSVQKVGEARGVVLLAGAMHGIEVEEFTPAVVKKTVTGSGRASKPQVQSMMARLLGLEPPPEPVDVTDALALAYCCCRRAWRRSLAPARSSSRDLLRRARTMR
ncbi:MAG: crossover junction endodeoxyribonuclease RuvC [Planctomycetes bacterium]|nr:crossover junction endodeoxyribonuclease RuvC [Planctomycetota bacterium]